MSGIVGSLFNHRGSGIIAKLGTDGHTFNSGGAGKKAVTEAVVVVADGVDGSKLADDAVDSEHYTDGSIDNAHIADDAIDSEHYAAASIDNAHLADNAADTAEIADNAITLAKMAGGTDGNIISFDASGDPVAIATGSDGQVLTSTGAGSPPAFEAVGGGDNTPSWGAVPSGNFTNAGAYTATLMPCATEIWDTDSAFTNTTTFKFTVPSGEAGKYAVFGSSNIAGMPDNADTHLYFYKNGSNTLKGMSRIYVGTGEGGIYNSSSAVLDLDEDDYVQCYVTVSVAGGNLSDWQATSCHFMGFKLAGV
jgi:hypothetical protein